MILLTLEPSLLYASKNLTLVTTLLDDKNKISDTTIKNSTTLRNGIEEEGEGGEKNLFKILKSGTLGNHIDISNQNKKVTERLNSL